MVAFFENNLVVDMLCTGGDPGPTRQRVFWGVSEGVLAALLIVLAGDEGCIPPEALAAGKDAEARGEAGYDPDATDEGSAEEGPPRPPPRPQVRPDPKRRVVP